MRDSYYLDHRVAARYDAEHADLAVTRDDIPFYVELAKEAADAGQAVLELGCGTGRVTLPIAAAGIDVVGLDSSAAMLAVARDKAGAHTNPRWIEADMTTFSIDQRFGLIIIPFRSFLLLLTVKEQTSCLARIHDHLVPGGRLAFNISNPNLLTMGQGLSSRRGSLQRPEGTPEPTWSSRDYKANDQASTETRSAAALSDEGAVIAQPYRELRLRYVFQSEMEHLLTLTGFTIEALHGWFDRRPFTRDSDEMVWLARRRSLQEFSQFLVQSFTSH